MGLLVPGKAYTLDMDATAIESNVKSAKKTYKKHFGFMPMVCMIGKLPIYISMRSGNANPMYDQIGCLKDVLYLLKENGITVDRVRIDGAGYQREILDFLDAQGLKFVISAHFTGSIKKFAIARTGWQPQEFILSNLSLNVQTSSGMYTVKNSGKPYRVAAMRIHTQHVKEFPSNWKLVKKHLYRFVITNDYEKHPLNLFYEYKQRGAIEQNFSSLKGDFGWRILPFSKLNHNLVYMQLAAFASNIYQGLLKEFAQVSETIKETQKLSTFRGLFIKIVCTIRHGIYWLHGQCQADFQKM
jgi:hypothetical protein